MEGEARKVVEWWSGGGWMVDGGRSGWSRNNRNTAPPKRSGLHVEPCSSCSVLSATMGGVVDATTTSTLHRSAPWEASFRCVEHCGIC